MRSEGRGISSYQLSAISYQLSGETLSPPKGFSYIPPDANFRLLFYCLLFYCPPIANRGSLASTA
jgi:hypothetical protein